MHRAGFGMNSKDQAPSGRRYYWEKSVSPLQGFSISSGDSQGVAPGCFVSPRWGKGPPIFDCSEKKQADAGYGGEEVEEDFESFLRDDADDFSADEYAGEKRGEDEQVHPQRLRVDQAQVGHHRQLDEVHQQETPGADA